MVRATLPKLEESGRCELCWKKTYLVLDSLCTTKTFTTETYQETFNIQKGHLYCHSEKMICLLKCSKVCGEVPYIEKPKTKFHCRFSNYKSKHRAFRKGNMKVPQKRFHAHYCVDGHSNTDDWDFVIFKQYEYMSNWKKRENFW